MVVIKTFCQPGIGLVKAKRIHALKDLKGLTYFKVWKRLFRKRKRLFPIRKLLFSKRKGFRQTLFMPSSAGGAGRLGSGSITRISESKDRPDAESACHMEFHACCGT